MSNFICSECGMTNIDCGHDGYKTPKEIELEKKVHILNEANMKLENELGHLADLSKKVELLQEQLKEARHTIYCIANTDGSDCKTILETIIRDAKLYLEKWGIPSEKCQEQGDFPSKKCKYGESATIKKENE